MKTLLSILFVLVSFTSYSQSTVILSKVFDVTNAEDIVFTDELSSVQYSKSNRVVVTIKVQANAKLELLEFIAERIKIKRVIDIETRTHTFNIDKLKTIVVRDKVINFVYDIKVLMPKNGNSIASK